MAAVNFRIGVAQGTSPYDGPSIFRRQQNCLKCSDEQPQCPPCDESQKCIFTSQTCEVCRQAKCIPDPNAVSSGPAAGPAIGPIVGGVIGGLVAISIITYLVWKYCIKNKRGEYEEEWQSESQSKEGTVRDVDGVRQSRRQSAQSVHSLASTVLTRASNIIQIAYIPGVTNRAAPNSPTVLVPPVPPIPLALSENGSPSPYGDQHFFVPGNLRDSTYSGISNYTDRTSYARTSYAPRSSVASTIYGKNAVVGPVQKGTLLKPSIVSVKSKPNSGPNTPPVPAVDYEKYEQPPPSPAFSIGATFFKNASASTATTVRPQVVRVGSAPKVVEVKSASGSSPASVTEEEPTESAKAVPDAQSGETLSTRDSTAVTIIDDTPALDQGPFSDPPARSSTQSSSDLSTVIEEATRRAAETRKSDAGSSLNRARSPFSDEHAVKE